MINRVNIQKFSLPEAVANSNGKTSGSATCGMFMIFVGTICFFVGTFKSDPNTLIQSLALVSLGTSLVAINKLNPTKDTTNTPDKDEKDC